jgi:membrane associated rhomboid family serine protease
VPESIIIKYFYSYPGRVNPVNWILSSLFHGNPAHLISNLIFLYILGRSVEAKLGKEKWILFYSIASLVSMMVDSMIRGFIIGEKIPSVGASGAIAGIAAVTALRAPFICKINGVNFPFPMFLIAWTMIYSDFSGLFQDDKIAHWAHLAGFFSVFLTSYLLSEKDRANLNSAFKWNLVFFFLTVVLMYFIEKRLYY